jgi:hypothetical protein
MKIKLLSSAAALLLASALPALAQSQTNSLPSPARAALFDGKTLDGWETLKCDAVVENGNLLLRAGNGMVQTRKQYGDFILEFEWKSLKQDHWDSGVYFRYDSIPAAKPWPPRYQVNLRQGAEGNVDGLEDAASHGLFKKGEWNSFKLTVRGTTAELAINGKPAWKADGLQGPKQGFIGLQAEVPAGGQCLFRNLHITELK